MNQSKQFGDLWTSAFKEYWRQAWADYIVTIATYVTVPVVSQHCWCTSTNNTQRCTFVESHERATVSPSVVFDSHRQHWQVAGQLQLHCLNTLFISCICAFTYLASSIIFMADTCSSNHPCCSVECSCKSHTWVRQYTGTDELFMAYTDFGNQGTINVG